MSEAVLGPKSAKYRVFGGYTWKTPVYLENTWVSCRFPPFRPRFCPRPALRLRETREFPEGNSRETEWSTKHPLVSLETSGNAKCWGPSGFPLGCRKPSDRPKSPHLHEQDIGRTNDQAHRGTGAGSTSRQGPRDSSLVYIGQGAPGGTSSPARCSCLPDKKRKDIVTAQPATGSQHGGLPIPLAISLD